MSNKPKSRTIQRDQARQRKRDPVAKNINKFNKPATHKDRKKLSKRVPVHLDYEFDNLDDDLPF